MLFNLVRELINNLVEVQFIIMKSRDQCSMMVGIQCPVKIIDIVKLIKWLTRRCPASRMDGVNFNCEFSDYKFAHTYNENGL